MSLASLFPQIAGPVLRLWLLKSLIWMRQHWLLRLVFVCFSLLWSFHSLLWRRFPEQNDYLVSSGSVFMTFLSMLLLKAEWGKSFKIPRPSASRRERKEKKKVLKTMLGSKDILFLAQEKGPWIIWILTVEAINSASPLSGFNPAGLEPLQLHCSDDRVIIADLLQLSQGSVEMHSLLAFWKGTSRKKTTR